MRFAEGINAFDAADAAAVVVIDNKSKTTAKVNVEKMSSEPTQQQQQPVDDVCSLCHKEQLLHPTMKLLRSICGHRVCDSCVATQFAKQLVLLCPVCKSQLRRAQFTDENANSDALNKEVQLRRRVEREWNKREADFPSLAAFNDYLEEREDIVYNLVNGIDVEATQQKITAYREANRESITRNNAIRASEDELLKEKVRIEEEQWILRRQQFLRQDQRERLVKLRAEAEFLDGLSAGTDVAELEARLNERRADARAEAAKMLDAERIVAERRRIEEEEAELAREEQRRESEAAVLARREEARQRKRVIGANFNADVQGAPSLLGAASAAVAARASAATNMDEDSNDNSDNNDNDDNDNERTERKALDAKNSAPAYTGVRDPLSKDAIAAGGWLDRYDTERIQQEAINDLAAMFARFL
jgi:CDK-activating kinase assembly factor MAT1